MNPKEHKSFLRWCMLGAIGGLLMAAGDWLLGCIPIQETDTGMFQRAYYLSGEYALWRPVLIVALGAIGSFLYSFMVKALNADIRKTYRKTKRLQNLCGIFTVAVALAIHLWSATLAWFTAYLGPRIGQAAVIAAGHCLSGRYARFHFADVSSDGAFHRASFCDAAHRKNPVSPVDARVSSAHLERSSRRHSGSCAGDAGTGCHMDVRHEPEQHKQRHRDLVHRSG